MRELDMRGKQCPIPVIEAKRAMEATVGELVSVRVDNEIAVENLKKLAKSLGAEAEVSTLGEEDFIINLSSQAGVSAGSLPEEKPSLAVVTQTTPAAGTVVVITSDKMGEPEEILGKILIRGFLYAVSRLDELPKTIILYNGGARLTTAESDSLEDLRLMESRGVEILTCGTCLKHLGLEESLKVGSVSNMYDIVDRMASAGKIIRP